MLLSSQNKPTIIRNFSGKVLPFVQLFQKFISNGAETNNGGKKLISNAASNEHYNITKQCSKNFIEKKCSNSKANLLRSHSTISLINQKNLDTLKGKFFSQYCESQLFSNRLINKNTTLQALFPKHYSKDGNQDSKFVLSDLLLCSKRGKNQDPCKKKEPPKPDVCKKKCPPPKKEDPCKKKDSPKKDGPCKQKDPCKKKDRIYPKTEPSKTSKKQDPCKKKDPCPPKKVDPCKKKDPCPPKKEDPCKKKEDPCKKKEDPCKKKEDPCKKKEAPCKKKEDPCKKKEDPCKKKEDPCKKKEDPCKKKCPPKKKDPCAPKKEDPCKKKDPCPPKKDPCKKEDPCPPKNENKCKPFDPCGKPSKPKKDPCAELSKKPCSRCLIMKEADLSEKPVVSEKDYVPTGGTNVMAESKKQCCPSTTAKKISRCQLSSGSNKKRWNLKIRPCTGGNCADKKRSRDCKFTIPRQTSIGVCNSRCRKLAKQKKPKAKTPKLTK